MTALIIVSAITLAVFIAVFYQSHRDQQRWKRISSGRSLFGDREDIPPLVVDGKTFEAHEQRVLVIWHDLKQTSFKTVSDARTRIDSLIDSGSTRAREARIFSWDGAAWQQRR
jgi:hypothetical protein